MEIKHIAHVRGEDLAVQSMKEHTLGVAALAKEFASKVMGESALGEVGYLLGLLHDFGKYQEGFQRYISFSSGLTTDGTSVSTPHSAVGALQGYQELKRHWLGKIVANCVAGHHRGLYDDAALLDLLENSFTERRLNDAKKGARESLSTFESLLNSSLAKATQFPARSLHRADLPLLTRMLFSSLIDADFIDTERFMAPERSERREQHFASVDELQKRLESFLSQFSSDTPINKARSKFSEQCKSHGERAENGIYSLFLPTGGGKTLASMRWALANATACGRERVIYVIPYTSIITQTARIFRDIFGEENVLEHHSDIDTSDEDKYNITKLLAENWQVPIVVTTNVQFFESLYSNRVGRSRKLHNICNAVVVFDEVQTFPSTLLHPMLRVIESLNRLCKTQILFCTATLPVFDENLNQAGRMNQDFYHLQTPIQEVIPYDVKEFEVFDKVDYHMDTLQLSFQELAARLSEHESFLCIVNSRKDAAQLFASLRETYTDTDLFHLFHLSRLMCSDHIKHVLTEVIKRLKNGKPVKLISTQLIEAGVDVDFPVVYRAKAGLDSIIQAGGRCNREGKRASGEVFVFELTDGGKPFGDIRLGSYAADDVVNKRAGTDWKVYDTEVIREYYRSFYARVESFDKKRVADNFWSNGRMNQLRFDFETAAHDFTYIDDNTTTLLVPHGTKGEALIQKIITHQPMTKDDFHSMSKLQVALYERDLAKLFEAGSVETVTWQNQTLCLLTDTTAYSEETGLLLENHWINDDLLI